MKVKIIKPHPEYKVGETIEVTPNVAFGLIDSGYAEKTKDITPREYRKK